MAAEKSARYWKARAEALEALNRRLHERLMMLAASLPPEYLDLFEADRLFGERPRPAPPVMDPGEDGPHLTPSDVEPEMRSLWERTAPPKGD
jgi:hypothetical protein